MLKIVLIVCFALKPPLAPTDPDFGAQPACFAADYFDSRRFEGNSLCQYEAAKYASDRHSHARAIAILVAAMRKAPTSVAYRCIRDGEVGF